MSEALVVVGNGMAATRLVKELSSRALGKFSILVIGDEPRSAYNRVLLSSYLAKEIDAGSLDLLPRNWSRQAGVTYMTGSAAASIDRHAKTVLLANGKSIRYNKLVLATGSQPIRLPKPGMNLPGVVTFRDLQDVSQMIAAAKSRARAVVIGGGLLGIEAAYGLKRIGADVTLIHIMDRLMERQLDGRAAAMLKDAIERKGIDVKLSADTAFVEGEACAEAVVLTDGTRLDASLVVCAVGIRPNILLSQSAGLDTGRGVKVNDLLRTSDPHIYAIGECAEHRGVCYGLVEPAYDQANILAAHLSGKSSAAYEGSMLSTNLKVSGVSVFSAGDFEGTKGSQSIVYADTAGGVYKKLVVSGNRLTGAMLYGDATDARWYLELMRAGTDIGHIRESLAFGQGMAVRMAA